MLLFPVRRVMESYAIRPPVITARTRIALCFMFALVSPLTLVLSCSPRRLGSPQFSEQSKTSRVAMILASQPRQSQSLEGQLADILSAVEPWPEHDFGWHNHPPNLSKSSWDALVLAATIIQSFKPEMLEWTLRNYQTTNDRGSRLDDSKLLLLMRVAFDLPEAGLRNDWTGFGGWRDWSGSDNLATNLAWPISWNAGQPSLVVGFTAFQGPRYDAALEYRYLYQKYGFRDLSSYHR